MNKTLLTLLSKNTDTLIEQTKRKPQKMLDFQLKNSAESLSVNKI